MRSFQVEYNHPYYVCSQNAVRFCIAMGIPEKETMNEEVSDFDIPQHIQAALPRFSRRVSQVLKGDHGSWFSGPESSSNPSLPFLFFCVVRTVCD